MQVPQLIFGSSNRGSIRGYQLLGRSKGIDERIAKDFCRWAPSHGALQDPTADASSLNFFPVADDKFIVARTVYGGPEYSGRGGLQVVTIALLLEKRQLEHHGSPLQLAHTAIALGYLILPSAVRKMLLPVILPRKSLQQTNDHRRQGDADCSSANAVVDALRLITSDRKVVIIGSPDPTNFLSQLFALRDHHDLAKFSFSTGLKPTVSRDFSIQFLRSADHVAIRQLDSQQFVCLKLEPPQSVVCGD